MRHSLERRPASRASAASTPWDPCDGGSNDPAAGFGSPPRSSAVRALRLVMAAGAAAAGLCLVLAMIALAVTIGGANIAGTVSDHAPKRHHGGTTSPAQPRPHPGPAIVVYQGSGSGKHGPFDIKAPGTWGLGWTFRCPAGLQDGFSVGEIGSGQNTAGKDIEISASGPAGSGLSWDPGDPGRHSLIVVSDCPWTIRIRLPRRTPA
jgi:hypothetical protein